MTKTTKSKPMKCKCGRKTFALTPEGLCHVCVREAHMALVAKASKVPHKPTGSDAAKRIPILVKLVQHEDPRYPLSDYDLCREIRASGYPRISITSIRRDRTNAKIPNANARRAKPTWAAMRSLA